MTQSETQAARLIRICGAKNLAKWAGVTETSVYRWDHPKDKGGSDGLVPVRYHEPILIGARSEGIDLTPDHFFSGTPALGPKPDPAGDEAAA